MMFFIKCIWVNQNELFVNFLLWQGKEVLPSSLLMQMVGKHGNTIGISERVLSTFLYEIVGVTSLNDMVVVAVTNRIDAFDEALKHPGRFDCLIEVKPCQCDQDKIRNIRSMY